MRKERGTNPARNNAMRTRWEGMDLSIVVGAKNLAEINESQYIEGSCVVLRSLSNIER